MSEFKLFFMININLLVLINLYPILWILIVVSFIGDVFEISESPNTA